MSKASQLLTRIGDNSVPVGHRASMLIDILAEAQSGESSAQAIAKQVFERLEDGTVYEVAKERAEVLKSILKQLEFAPLKPATFVQLRSLDGSKANHAMVTTDAGEYAYVVAHDQEAALKLKLGDRVLLDVQGKFLVDSVGNGIHAGIESRFERKVDHRHIEVINHQDERQVVLADPGLIDRIEHGKVSVGAPIIITRHGNIAIFDLPPLDRELGHYRFLDRGAVPDVIVDRDIGAPPRVIEQVARHIREEMVRPELRRRFKLRRCITRLLSGVSGTGKTLAVQAIHRLMYEIMSEITGVPVAELPPRVIRFKSSKLLSMWVGESDKNADRIFDEAEELAEKPFKTPKGRELLLPVLVIMEEAEGLGRARGEEPIYDRILTTILQRLDPNREGLSDKLVIFLSTTNTPHIVDPAFLRRIGGEIETFGRLDQRSFGEVLRKQVEGLPASGEGTQKQIWKSITSEIGHLLFDDGVDPGVVELSFQGQSCPMVKYRRDFLTGALVDRSVQQAATETWEQSLEKDPKAGIDSNRLMKAINHQIMGVAQQLTPYNAFHYLDLPEGAKVTRVQSIKQTS